MFRNIYDLKTNDFYKELVEIKNMNLKIKDLINNQINFKDYIICGFTENNLIEVNFTKYNNKNLEEPIFKITIMYDFNKFTLDIEKIIYVNEITLEHEGILVGKIHWLLKKDNNYNEFKIKTLNTMLNHKKSKIVSFYTFIYDAEIKKVMHTYLREAIYEDINTFINLKDENLLFYKALYVDELKELKKYKNLPFSKYSL